MPARSIFIGGTASHVGKSWMTAAVCRYLHQRGLRVAPFKAQNMSNNSHPLPDGSGEIGRAQVAQAEACGLAPHADFNPILLKPNSDTSSQVVLNGRVWRTLPAREYYLHHDFLLEHVLAAHARLASRFDYIVMEGAGSVAELNLKRTDLVNLNLARRVGARALLVGDIDRGGIFASIIGTLCLLEPEERAAIPAFAVNRFRGDRSLFDNGVRILEEKTQRPCLGVFPFAADIHLDEEDGVAIDQPRPTASDIAILRFPRISNLTDFRLLPDAAWISAPTGRQFHAIILPGTKNTLADLAWLRERQLDTWLEQQYAQGATLIGICGGYQMLGERIDDPLAAESAAGSAPGLGLLRTSTTLAAEKTTRAVHATTPTGHTFAAYEIHLGLTPRPAGAPPFATIEGEPEGVHQGRLIGTYLHGALEDHRVLSLLLGRPIAAAPRDKQADYDALGHWFAANAHVKLFEDLYL